MHIDQFNGWAIELQAIEGDSERALVQVARFGVPVGQVILQTNPACIGSIIAEKVGDH